MINHLERFTWTGHNLDLNLYYSVDRQKSTTFRGGTTVNANEDRKKTLDRSISPQPAPKKTNESKRDNESGQTCYLVVLYFCGTILPPTDIPPILILLHWIVPPNSILHLHLRDHPDCNCTHTHMRSGWPDCNDILCLELPVVCTVNLILYSPGMLTWYCCWLGI